MNEPEVASRHTNALEDADDETRSAALRLLAKMIARDLTKGHRGGKDKACVRRVDDPPVSRDGL